MRYQTYQPTTGPGCARPRETRTINTDRTAGAPRPHPADTCTVVPAYRRSHLNRDPLVTAEKNASGINQGLEIRREPLFVRRIICGSSGHHGPLCLLDHRPNVKNSE
ncbi:hypothetical protein J6590_016928 [Homalodisca vitripennis]|nr:hypothetical protein J6590_016928 [Homalodisca vitripennis]